MTVKDVVERARSAMNRGCVYQLGKGGFDPNLPLPWTVKPACDCSGFVAWCFGLNRHTDNPFYKNYNGGWLETTAIVRDAKSSFGLFDEVPWHQAQPGMVVVYGDTIVDGEKRQGHVGLITEVDPTGPAKVVHCSKGNWHKTGDAIQETGVAIWNGRKDSIVARCAVIEGVA